MFGVFDSFAHWGLLLFLAKVYFIRMMIRKNMVQEILAQFRMKAWWHIPCELAKLI